jgi:hypothetical protein
VRVAALQMVSQLQATAESSISIGELSTRQASHSLARALLDAALTAALTDEDLTKVCFRALAVQRQPYCAGLGLSAPLWCERWRETSRRDQPPCARWTATSCLGSGVCSTRTAM